MVTTILIKEDLTMTRCILGVIVICALMLTGVGVADVYGFEVLTKEDFVHEIVVREDLVKTADNAIILFDSSSSMAKPFLETGLSRYEVAKKTLIERNEYFPDIGHNIGLYLYTPWAPLYPVQPYNREKVRAALDQLPDKPAKGTFLVEGLLRLESILDGLSGRTVVFLMTDGTYSRKHGPYKTPGRIAKRLADKYDVCFYVISTADDEASQKVLERVGSVDFCARVIPFEAFINRPEYNSGALYVVKATAELRTTTETKIAGVEVSDVLFDFDKAEIRPEMKRQLLVLAEFLQEQPDAYVVLAGYTDSVGSEEYNLKLSRRRAAIVTEYLRDNFNISPDRVLSLWFGQMNPAADNSTEEGRRLNRRVEIAVGGVSQL